MWYYNEFCLCVTKRKTIHMAKKNNKIEPKTILVD
jgi:hypothetical protein